MKRVYIAEESLKLKQLTHGLRASPATILLTKGLKWHTRYLFWVFCLVLVLLQGLALRLAALTYAIPQLYLSQLFLKLTMPLADFTTDCDDLACIGPRSTLCVLLFQSICKVWKQFDWKVTICPPSGYSV